MSRKLLPSDFIEFIAHQQGITKKKSEAFVRAFFEVIEEGLRNDSFVKIKGFGTFKLVSVSERESVNINTGERFQISGHTKVSFIPDNNLKELVNRPFSHFETTFIPDSTTQEEIDILIDTTEEHTEAETTSFLENVHSSDVEQDNTPTSQPTPQPTSTTEDVAITTNHLIEIIEETEDTSEAENEGEDKSIAEETPSSTIPHTEEAHEPVSTTCETPQPTSEDTIVQKVAEEKEVAIQPSTEIKVTEEPQSLVSEEIESDTSDDTPTSATNSTSILSTEEEMNTTHTPKKSRWILISLLWVLTIIISYIAGYHRIIPLSAQIHEEAPTTSQQDSSKVVAPIDSLSLDTIVTQTPQTILPAGADTLSVIRGIKKTDAEKLAEGYPQVEVGSFLIIGTFKKHTMRPGDTLFKLARKVYGHKDYVKYIIRYNQFSDPNNVHIGSEILLPQLIEKEECAG